MNLARKKQGAVSVTKRERAQKTLSALSSRQEAILAAVPDIVVEVDKHKVYTWANQAGREFFGDDVIGKEAGFFFEGEQSTYASVQPLFDGRRDVVCVDSWQRRKDGEKRLLAWRCRALKDESGNITGALSAARDITERRQTEMAIAQLSGLKQEMLGAGSLPAKLNRITQAVVEIFGADFARIWMVARGDLCDQGCMHAAVTDGPDVCRNRASCLHLMASSGRYTRLDGTHRRVPLGSYKIGRVASGEDAMFMTNDVVNDARVHDREWARSLGLVSFAGFRLISAEGRPVGVLALFSQRKISPHEQALLEDAAHLASEVILVGAAEAALRNSEQKYRELLQHANSIILRWTRDGKVAFLNEFGQKFFGYTEAEILGRHVVGTIVPASGSTSGDLRPLIDQICAHPEAFEQNINENMRRNGERVWVAWANTLVLDEQGEPNEIMSIGSDITERKRAEEKVREQAALLDIANDAIYVTALDRTILYWNQGAARTYGWTSGEALNRRTTELMSPDHDAEAALIATLLEQGSWSGERWQVTKSGQKVVVLCRLTLMRDEQGQPQSVFAIDTDITEKKQLETQFMRAQRLESLGALASGIAHDLNNVLTPILMGAPLVRGAVLDKSARNVLTAMEDSAKRGADIIKHVLTFARGAPGERVPLQPRHFIRELVRIYGETFPKNIRIETAVAANLWTILGDATQMHQALMNLCVNARDAMPAGGVLRLTAENVVLDEAFARKTPEAKPGLHVCLGVSDTGTGIPPEHLDKLFDPFFTTKAPGQGTGLGLSTVLGIARGHGGFVKVRTEVGEGTSFELYLPAAPSAEVATKAAADSMPPWAQGELILVVDDEDAVREITRKVLESSGYKVMTVSDGAEAVRIFGQHHNEIQVIITDMVMPGMDGPSLVDALRAIEPGVRIIGISGVGESTGFTNLQALALPVFLTKPFPIQKLLTALHDVLHPPGGAASA